MFNKTIHQARHRIRGAAAIETLMLCSVLLIAASGIVMLGKLQSIDRQSVQLARHVAWQPTGALAHASDAHYRERFFADRSGAFAARGARADVDGAPLQPWRDRRGERARLGIANAADLQIDADALSVRIQRGQINAPIADAANRLVSSMGQPLSFMRGTSWGLGQSGERQIEVAVPLRPHPWLGDTGRCRTPDGQAQHCVQVVVQSVHDSWGARDDDQSRARTRRLLPSAALAPVGNGLAQAGRIPFFKELRGLEGAFGYVDTTVLPQGTRRAAP